MAKAEPGPVHGVRHRQHEGGQQCEARPAEDVGAGVMPAPPPCPPAPWCPGRSGPASTTIRMMNGQASDRPFTSAGVELAPDLEAGQGEGPDHGQRQRDQAADERHRQRLEREGGERRVVEDQDRGEQHRGQAGEAEGQAPHHRRHQPLADPHQPGGGRVVGDGPHGQADPGPAQDEVQAGEERDHVAEQDHLVPADRVVGAGDGDRLPRPERRVEGLAPGVAPPGHDEHEPLEEQEQPQGGHRGQRRRRPASER